ncbi:MAG TPA: chemotaxis protein CheW [Burkholderiaceae bacterium]|nr:chemotaxis protein CheW [Burkholderiaceae bacterium]
MGVMERFDALRSVHTSEYLTFRLDTEEYGIDILKVQEIRGYDAVTKIAGAPSCVKGVINLRGVIVPIVDLRMLLHLGEAKCDGFTVAIILNLSGRVIGAVVDSVSDVLQLDPVQIKEAPAFRSTLDSNFVMGLGAIGSAEEARMIILIDIEKLVASSDIALVTKAVA